MKGWYILKCVVCGVIFVALIGFITMWLWNWLVPDLFNGPAITYWQALGLLVLTKILFWGFGGKQHHYNDKDHAWKSRFTNKFANMTPDEREAMKRKMKEKWCSWDKPRTGGDESVSND
jgi:hypothetical protein